MSAYIALGIPHLSVTSILFIASFKLKLLGYLGLS
nr:MAG TPA: hypothetical protein [Caudoviricetes sp.]